MNKNLIAICVTVVLVAAIIATMAASISIYGKPYDPEYVCTWSRESLASAYCLELAKRPKVTP